MDLAEDVNLYYLSKETVTLPSAPAWSIHQSIDR